MEPGEYKFTEYFEKEVLRKRSYLKREWCINVIETPIKVEAQERNRFRFWGIIPELEGRIPESSPYTIRGLFTMPFLTGGLNHETELLS
jgi:hypothetical protein